MTIEDPRERQLTATKTGALEELAGKEGRALNETFPGYRPGMTAGELADRLEDQSHGVKPEPTDR